MLSLQSSCVKDATPSYYSRCVKTVLVQAGAQRLGHRTGHADRKLVPLRATGSTRILTAIDPMKLLCRASKRTHYPISFSKKKQLAASTPKRGPRGKMLIRFSLSQLPLIGPVFIRARTQYVITRSWLVRSQEACSNRCRLICLPQKLAHPRVQMKMSHQIR